MSNVIAQAAGALVLVGIGIGAGWYAAGGAEPDAADAEVPDTAAPVLSAQALQNLGVTIQGARLSAFVRTIRVQASVVDAPLNARPVTTGLGGIVTELHVRPGERIAAGAPLMTLARAAIARPELTLTGNLLPSLSEDFHTAVAAYRSASTQVAIVKRELARVKTFTESGTKDDLPALPRQRQIDLEYDLDRANQSLSNARHELERHGLTVEEMDSVASNNTRVPNDRLWRNALAANGFWGERESLILELIPSWARKVPWVVGALGELAAAGRVDPDLELAVRQSKPLREHFAEALSLLVEGHSVGRVRLLADAGELNPVVIIRAPQGAPDWDVERIVVRPGENVDAGATLVDLHDARTMWLQAEPIGEEVGAIGRAYSERVEMTASPLIEGGGTDLIGLFVDRLATRGGEHERGAQAVVVCSNTELASSGDRAMRTWTLRAGQQYVLHVPEQQLDERFVLPAEAVVRNGAERVVLVQEGDTFRMEPVHVEFEDESVAVVANDGAIFPGDPICVTGAFALSLSLMSGDQKADPHAGHSHD